MSEYPDVPPVKVHIIADDTASPKTVRSVKTSFSQVTLGAGIAPQMILGHAPNRIRAFIQVTTGQCWLAQDQNTAKKQDNSCANIQAFAGGFYVLSTGEMWATSTTTSNIAIIQEFEDNTCL